MLLIITTAIIKVPNNSNGSSSCVNKMLYMATMLPLGCIAKNDTINSCISEIVPSEIAVTKNAAVTVKIITDGENDAIASGNQNLPNFSSMCNSFFATSKFFGSGATVLPVVSAMKNGGEIFRRKSAMFIFDLSDNQISKTIKIVA